MLLKHKMLIYSIALYVVYILAHIYSLLLYTMLLQKKREGKKTSTLFTLINSSLKNITHSCRGLGLACCRHYNVCSEQSKQNSTVSTIKTEERHVDKVENRLLQLFYAYVVAVCSGGVEEYQPKRHLEARNITKNVFEND